MVTHVMNWGLVYNTHYSNNLIIRFQKFYYLFTTMALVAFCLVLWRVVHYDSVDSLPYCIQLNFQYLKHRILKYRYNGYVELILESQPLFFEYFTLDIWKFLNNLI